MDGDPGMQTEAYIQIAGDLFETVQESGVFEDSKTFVDSVPRDDPSVIMEQFRDERGDDDFDLRAFVEDHFMLPEEVEEPVAPHKRTMAEHIEELWNRLIRPPYDNMHAFNTLIPLPNSYVVPGGRFREIYYWDSYFTAVGLVATGNLDVVQDMIKNIVHFIGVYGFVPNANRVYYLSRSQPPVLVSLLELLGNQEGATAVAPYVPAAEEEYSFWMDGQEKLRSGAVDRSYRRAVKLEDGVVMNRYFDDDGQPRPESYREDISLAERSDREDTEKLFRDIRAAAESGWDFSSRWLADGESMTTIHTTDIIPVDLNAMLYNMERQLYRWNKKTGAVQTAKKYREAAKKRKRAFNTFFWDEGEEFFFDYNWRQGEQTDVWSLAAVTPLFFGIASDDQAASVADHLKETFLFDGGLSTTLSITGEQWDKPNGWAPLHWLAINGLLNYGHSDLAQEIAERWLRLNDAVFDRTGKMLEKYNVCNPSLEGGGGEYELQDGFGWTNGVAIALLENAFDTYEPVEGRLIDRSIITG